MGTKMFRKAAFGYNKKDVCSYIEDIIASVNKELKSKDSEIQSLRQEIKMLQTECGRLNDCIGGVYCSNEKADYGADKNCMPEARGILHGRESFSEKFGFKSEQTLQSDFRKPLSDRESFMYRDSDGSLKKNQNSVKISLPLQDPLKNILDKKILNQESASQNSESEFYNKSQSLKKKNSSLKLKSKYVKSATEDLEDDEMGRLKQKMEIMKKLAAKAARRFEEDLNSIEQI